MNFTRENARQALGKAERKLEAIFGERLVGSYSAAFTSVAEKNGAWYLTVDLPADLPRCERVTTERLGLPYFVKQAYEDPYGAPVDFTRDLCGDARTDHVIAGPLAALQSGKQTVEVWRE